MKWLKCLFMSMLACSALLVLCVSFILTATPAIADDDEGDDNVLDDTYIAPSDGSGSDESIREEGQSGFDTPGPIYIDENDYYSDPNIPEPGPPVPVDEEESSKVEDGN